jgi:protein-S-isoprenylcysteine O-methyltransferase Ste14
MPASSRLPRSSRVPPSLGARGQGWFALQAVLMALVGVSALTGVYWPDSVAGTFAVVGFVLIAAAVVLLALAAVSLLLARAITALPRPREGSMVAQGGVYRIVRHPVYGALLLIAFGWSLAESPLGLIPGFLLAVVFDLKARLEEAWLQERHPEYATYRERTPRRFVPGLY